MRGFNLIGRADNSSEEVRRRGGESSNLLWYLWLETFLEMVSRSIGCLIRS